MIINFMMLFHHENRESCTYDDDSKRVNLHLYVCEAHE